MSELGLACANAPKIDSVCPITAAAGNPASASFPNSRLVYDMMLSSAFGKRAAAEGCASDCDTVYSLDHRRGRRRGYRARSMASSTSAPLCQLVYLVDCKSVPWLLFAVRPPADHALDRLCLP